jgi:hypothetical protein
LAAAGATPTGDYAAVIKEFLEKSGPWFAIGALVLVLSIPPFLWKLPETIKALSSFIDMYRRTSHKINQERAKLNNAIEDRNKKKVQQGVRGKRK